MLVAEEAYGWRLQEIPSSLEVLNQAFFYNVANSSTALITATVLHPPSVTSPDSGSPGPK